LSSLGNLDSLSFTLSSSDNGAFGMNTPAYFCIDDFLGNDIDAHSQEDLNSVKIFPNPVQNYVTIYCEECIGDRIEIWNMQGQKMNSIISIKPINTINISTYSSGSYFFTLANNKSWHYQIFKN